MAIWLIRAGSHGEYEKEFTTENRVYVTWDKLAVNLAKLANRELITRFEHKIQTTLARIWGDEAPELDSRLET